MIIFHGRLILPPTRGLCFSIERASRGLEALSNTLRLREVLVKLQYSRLRESGCNRDTGDCSAIKLPGGKPTII